MKKYFIGLVLMFFFASIINAQVIKGTSNTTSNNDLDDITFGVKAGFSFSTFSGGDYVDITPKPGFYVGALVEIPALIDGFYFQPEVMIQLQGADIGVDNLNLLYLHVPLMGKYHITEEIAVEFGPQIGVLLADNWDEDLSIIDTKKVNIGLNIGGGYRLNERLYFQLRFSPGFSRVIESTTTKNMSFQLGASYFF